MKSDAFDIVLIPFFCVETFGLDDPDSCQYLKSLNLIYLGILVGLSVQELWGQSGEQGEGKMH